jgi:5-methylcytosine-specific restriction endonuclease McrBC regulatory subunit McrC
MILQVNIDDILTNKEGKFIFELKEYNEIEFLIGKIDEFSKNDLKLADFLKKKVKIIQTQKGVYIHADSYVGSAEFEKFIMHIRPKFSEINKLPLLIDYAYELEDKDIVETELQFTSEYNLPLESLIRTLVSQCKKLIKTGLAKSYVSIQENVPFLRGKLLLTQQIQNDVSMNLKFGCEYDEYSSNIIENQIILFVLEKSYHLTKHPILKKQIQKIIHEFDMDVEYKEIVKNDFDIFYDRYNLQYEKIHLVCKLIFDELGVSDFYKHETSHIFPVFINMNDLFEKYVVKLLKDSINNNEFVIVSEPNTHKQVWESINLKNEMKKGIEPDIIIYSKKPKKEVSIIADVKYMPSTNVGEPQLYQIAFYLHEHKKQKGFALIPDSDQSDEIKWKSLTQGISIYLKKIPIDPILDMIYSKLSKEEIKTNLHEKVHNFFCNDLQNANIPHMIDNKPIR